MSDQLSGTMVVDLMHAVENNVKAPNVLRGGIVIDLGGLQVSVGPEVLESLRQIEAEKRQANASGTPSAMGFD
jgi:hypothetical protein